MGQYRLFFTGHLIRKISFLSLVFFLPVFLTRMFPAEVGGTLIIRDKDTIYHLTHNDLKTGERLFYGLIQDQQDMKSCVSCHNIHPVKEINWNPSAFEMAQAINGWSLEDLKRSLLNPVGKKLMAAHEGFTGLNDQQVLQLKGYLQEYYEQGGYSHKPNINQRLLFFGLLILFLLALLDLIWFKAIRFRAIHGTVLLITALLLTKFTVEEALAIGRSKNYAPNQPIKFSHAVHAGQNQINCLYCHSSAEYGKSAGIPSANVCLNCHMIVREGSRSGRFEINKIFAAVEQKQPILWKRVYSLPDHVFFSHAQHAGAGKLDCQRCHGSVNQMDRIIQVPDLSMGWCINCHRDTQVQFHDNQFYTKYEGLRKQLESGALDSITVDMIGGTDCMKCHY
jgi:hypothetical protein